VKNAIMAVPGKLTRIIHKAKEISTVCHCLLASSAGRKLAIQHCLQASSGTLYEYGLNGKPQPMVVFQRTQRQWKDLIDLFQLID
jgi:hypothetical protein